MCRWAYCRRPECNTAPFLGAPRTPGNTPKISSGGLKCAYRMISSDEYTAAPFYLFYHIKITIQMPCATRKCRRLLIIRASVCICAHRGASAAPGARRMQVRSGMRGRRAGWAHAHPNAQASGGRRGALGRRQSRGQHAQHERCALLWVYRGRMPPHTTGRTAQAGL